MPLLSLFVPSAARSFVVFGFRKVVEGCFHVILYLLVVWFRSVFFTRCFPESPTEFFTFGYVRCCIVHIFLICVTYQIVFLRRFVVLVSFVFGGHGEDGCRDDVVLTLCCCIDAKTTASLEESQYGDRTMCVVVVLLYICKDEGVDITVTTLCCCYVVTSMQRS